MNRLWTTFNHGVLWLVRRLEFFCWIWAIENTVYMVACDQIGVSSMGESVVVDPMGVVVASAGEIETLICAEIDTDRIAEVRAKLPAYKDRRPELYRI